MGIFRLGVISCIVFWGMFRPPLVLFIFRWNILHSLCDLKAVNWRCKEINDKQEHCLFLLWFQNHVYPENPRSGDLWLQREPYSGSWPLHWERWLFKCISISSSPTLCQHPLPAPFAIIYMADKASYLLVHMPVPFKSSYCCSVCH